MRHRLGMAALALPVIALTALSGCGSGQAGDAVSAGAAPPPHAGSLVKPRANVLFIIADDFRPLIGAYGAQVKTPNLDRLAAMGVRFTNAYAQFPICGASRASFLTGLRPNTIGPDANFEKFRCAAPDIVTLPQYFKNAGYRSIRVGKAYHQGVPSDIGTAGPDDPASWTETVNPSGHDHLPDTEKRIIRLTPGVGLGRAMAYLPSEAGDRDQTDGKVADAVVEALQRQDDTPFFMVAGFYRPHVPEVAPKAYFDLYPPDGETAEDSPAAFDATLPVSRNSDVANLGMTGAQQRQMIAAYKASVTFMDAQVGRVLDALEKSGKADSTIIVFTGDHGFLLGEHGMWAKNLLWDQATRVPLIIRVPGMRDAGRASTKTVEMVDLYPTLTQLAGLPHYARNQGNSLMPLLKDPDAASWDHPAFSQIYGARSIRLGKWRYSEWLKGTRGRELYDLDADPGERRNLADDPRYAKVMTALSARLPELLEKQSQPLLYRNPQADKPGRGSPPYPVVDNVNKCGLWNIG
ncbi:sulfatase [Sphingomonas sp.]|uniref:sulfatase n=1 Tax=Sphingomonas sp. TaxID=28214 RepID=UPI001ECA0220|nr:sulfatase [Sphingomonas sp.]MBX3592846.1 sulfatase [Sphingomonas sp.]